MTVKLFVAWNLFFFAAMVSSKHNPDGKISNVKKCAVKTRELIVDQ